MAELVPQVDPFAGVAPDELPAQAPEARALPQRVFIPFELVHGATSVLDVERTIRAFLDRVLERGYGWRLEEDLARYGWLLHLSPPAGFALKGRRVRPRLRGGDDDGDR